MKIVLDGSVSDATKRIYALEADGQKSLIWCADGAWEVSLEPAACMFHCKRGNEADAYVYLDPRDEAVIIYENGSIRREFVIVNGMLTLRGSEAE